MDLPTAPFNEFPKMSRFNREVIVTEKLDGTNAQIYIPEAGDVDHQILADGMPAIYAGSRTRWIQPGKNDNMGFAGWVEKNREDLLRLGPGKHFGEWWGKGIQRGYGVPDKRFSLFNVHRWGDGGVDKRPACCGVVPVLWRGNLEDLFDFDEREETTPLLRILDNLILEGSVAAPGFMDPEGIVIFHTAQGLLFKKTIKNDESPKSLVK